MDSELITNLQDYKIIGTLGCGSFGQTFLVENVKTHQKYAAKVSHKEFTNEVDQVYFASIMKTFSELQNPAFIKIAGINLTDFFSQNHFTILNDYLPKGSLANVFHNERNWFTVTKRYLNLLGIALGMQYLHSKEIVHGNLNPSNIVLDDQNYPHIADFGLSKFSKGQLIDLELPIYTAPEILEEKEFDEKADVYSYGIIAYKLVTGLEPFVEGAKYNQIANIIKGKRPDLSMIKDRNWKNFLQKCWAKNPKERPTFDQIIQNITDPQFYSLIRINFKVVSHYLKHYYPQNDGSSSSAQASATNNEDSSKEVPTFNVFLLGNPKTGKSALLKVLMDENANHPEPPATASISNSLKTFKTEYGDVNLSIYDTPGVQSIYQILNKHLNIANAIVVFTDISISEEYKKEQQWFDLAKKHADNPNIYIAASKADLQWKNKKEDLRAFAETNQCCGLFSTSWDDRESIDSLFNKVATDLIEMFPQGNGKSLDLK